MGVDFQIDGLPTTLAGADMMAEQDKKAFEIWAVSTIDGIPNEKKGADKGVDGRIRFEPDGKTAKYATVSVKGGKLKADDVRALAESPNARRLHHLDLECSFLLILSPRV